MQESKAKSRVSPTELIQQLQHQNQYLMQAMQQINQVSRELQAVLFRAHPGIVDELRKEYAEAQEAATEEE